MKTTQKIIKIGSSYGVTLPKKQLDANNISVGDKVKAVITPLEKSTTIPSETIEDYKKFVKQYGQTLKNLADR